MLTLLCLLIAGPTAFAQTSPWECSTWIGDEYDVSSSQNITNSIKIQNESTQIEFSFKRSTIHHCNRSLCSILSVTDEQNNAELLSFSIINNGNDSGLKIATIMDAFVVLYIDTIIPFDNQYHLIQLTITSNNDKIFSIDDTHHITYTSDGAQNDDDDSWINSTQNTLIIGDTAINSFNIGTITDICVADNNYNESLILRSSTAPSDIFTKLCDVEFDGTYSLFSFAFWDIRTNSAVYYSYTKNLYLKLIITANNDYVYVLTTYLHNNEFNNTRFVDSYCNIDPQQIGYLRHCVRKWFTYNPFLEQWINNIFASIIISCEDQCLSGLASYHRGTYIWNGVEYYPDGLIASRYYCSSCGFGHGYLNEGLYLYPIIQELMIMKWNSESYSDELVIYWILAEDHDTSLESYNIIAACDAGYLYDASNDTSVIESCSNSWSDRYNVSGSVSNGECETGYDHEYESCFEVINDNIGVSFLQTAVAYWSDVVYICCTDSSAAATLNFTAGSHTQLQSAWQQIQETVYLFEYYSHNFTKINLETNVISSVESPLDIGEESRSLALCNNDTHLFGVGSDSIFAYNLDTDTWIREVDNIPITSYTNCQVYEEKMFIFGGYGFNASLSGTYLHVKTHKDTIYKYNTKLTSLELLNVSLALPTINIRSLLAQHFVYLYSGYVDDDYVFQMQTFNAITEEIDLKTDDTFNMDSYNVWPGAYYDELQQQLVVVYYQTAYKLRSDNIYVDFSAISEQHVKPGEMIQIAPWITIEGCDEVLMASLSATFLFIAQDVSINHQVNIENGACSTICQGDDYKLCDLCENGIVPIIPAGAIVENVNITISSQTDIEALQSQITVLTVVIGECPAGEGVINDSLVLDCNLCQVQQFKVSSGNTPCYSCANDENMEGITCNGAYDIIIDYNLWFGVFSEHDNGFISPLDITQTDSIYSIRCPPQYCCADKYGCSFIDSETNNTMPLLSDSLCATNRDFNTPLCGRCVSGTYELMGTTACGDCADSANLLYLVPLGVVALVAAILLVKDSKPIDTTLYTQKKAEHGKLIKKDEIRGMTVMFTKVMMYYYQALSQVLASKGVKHSLIPLMALFNFSFDFGDSSSSSSGYCVIPFISNPLDEILLSAVFIGFVLFHFVWIAFIFHCIKIKSKSKNTTRQPMIAAAVLKLFVMIAGTMMSIGFKLLSCISFPNNDIVHFYDTVSDCFGGYWFLGLFLCIAVISFFIFLHWKISTQNDKERQSETNVFRQLVHIYTPSVWNFEFVLFSRRVIVAFCTSTRFLNAANMDTILLTVLVIYFAIHVHTKPFIYYRLNVMEGICLISVIVVLSASNQLNQQNRAFTEVFVALLIIMPFFFVIYYSIKSIRTIFFPPQEDIIAQQMLQMVKISKRAPVQMDIEQQDTNETNIVEKIQKNNEDIQVVDNDETVKNETANVVQEMKGEDAVSMTPDAEESSSSVP